MTEIKREKKHIKGKEVKLFYLIYPFPSKSFQDLAVFYPDTQEQHIIHSLYLW